jgi:hypothetical protein
MTRSIKLEADHVVIRVPLQEVHPLRVALRPCQCEFTKSHATENIRTQLERGLARAVSQKPKGETK